MSYRNGTTRSDEAESGEEDGPTVTRAGRSDEQCRRAAPHVGAVPLLGVSVGGGLLSGGRG